MAPRGGMAGRRRLADLAGLGRTSRSPRKTRRPSSSRPASLHKEEPQAEATLEPYTPGRRAPSARPSRMPTRVCRRDAPSQSTKAWHADSDDDGDPIPEEAARAADRLGRARGRSSVRPRRRRHAADVSTTIGMTTPREVGTGQAELRARSRTRRRAGRGADTPQVAEAINACGWRTVTIRCSRRSMSVRFAVHSSLSGVYLCRLTFAPVAGLGTLGDASSRPKPGGPGPGRCSATRCICSEAAAEQRTDRRATGHPPTRKKPSAGRRKGRQEVAMPVVHLTFPQPAEVRTRRGPPQP